MSARTPDKTLCYIITSRYKGKSVPEVAKELRMGTEQLKGLIFRHRLSYDIKYLRDSRIWHLRSKGLTLREISNITHTSISTIKGVIEAGRNAIAKPEHPELLVKIEGIEPEAITLLQNELKQVRIKRINEALAKVAQMKKAM